MFIFTQNKAKLVNSANVMDIYANNNSVLADEIGGTPVCLGTYSNAAAASIVLSKIKSAIAEALAVFDMPEA